MADRDVVQDDTELIEDTEQDDDSAARSRRPLLLLLLLLLLLCAITSVVDVWINREPDRARFITRNLACLQCHTELIPEFSKAAVHNPFMMEECTVCHTSHGKEIERTTFEGGSRTWNRVRTLMEWLPLKWAYSIYDSVSGVEDTDDGGRIIGTQTKEFAESDSMLVAPETDLCWICHGNLGPKRAEQHQHAPFENGYCTNCHDPHASDFRVLLVQDERDLCITCHPIGPELARLQVHPPVEQRYCTNCHDPHASEWRGILVDNQRDLCFTCHPSVAPLSLKAVQHHPFLYDNCTGCHEPHGSNFMPLLIKNEPPLCYDCHPQIRADFAQASSHPVNERFLDCSGCHNPHAADYAALIIAEDNELCYTCHAYPVRATYDSSAHWTNRLVCVRCHTPHGSAFAPILRRSNPDLCLQCHAWVESHDNQHPVRPVNFDVNAQTGLTCSSTCHDPHGTLYNYMIRSFYYPLDGQCLQCHDGVGVTF